MKIQRVMVIKGNDPGNNLDEKHKDEAVQSYYKEEAPNAYMKKILGNTDKEFLTNADVKKLKEAYDKSHDIRKFEIELYWKRTTYVWTLIAALITVCGVLMAGYFRLTLNKETKDALLWIVAVIAIFGLFITIISSRILQSGEYWQKNWEYHVNLLEPIFSGKLYGTLLNKSQQRYSIAKLNQFLYVLVLVAWLLLAEGIYFIMFDTPNVIYFGIPLICFGIFTTIITKTIDFKTLRKSETAMLHLSQWDVSIIEEKKNQNKMEKVRILAKRKIIATIINTLKIICLILLIAIFSTILYRLYS